MNILIADDDLTSRMMLASVLEKAGHQVQAVPDGTEALAALQAPGGPRLAVLDWLMPGLDGLEVCRQVRASSLGHAPYLLLLTSRSEKRDIATGLRSGADDYLTKPFDPLELNARIEVGCRLIALQERLTSKVQELEAALSQVKTLSGIIPICSNCKKIRDDKGYWAQVEAYVTKHSKAQFSHALCPDCLGKFFPVA